MVLALVSVARAETPQSRDPVAIGDLVYVHVVKHPELSVTANVDVDGNVSVPQLGNVHIDGLTYGEAAARIAQALQEKVRLRRPRVIITPSTMGLAVGGARTDEMVMELVELHNVNAETLSERLQYMVSEGGAVSYEPRTGALIITDKPALLQNTIAKVKELDAMPSQRRQLHIQAHLLEVQEGALKEYGARWFAQGDQALFGYYPMPPYDADIASRRGAQSDPFENERVGGVTARQATGLARRFLDEDEFDRRLQTPVQLPKAGQLFFGLLKDQWDIGTLIDALVADNKAELLASPHILAVNHQPAVIKSTQEFPFSELGTLYSGREQYSTRFLELGIKLDVTPHIGRDQEGDLVRLDLFPEVSYAAGSVNGVPIRDVRSFSGQAIVRNGQTLAVGGIYRSDVRNSEHRVPGFGRLPVVGKLLFSRRERNKIQTELIVFITPIIHDTPDTVTWGTMLELTPAMEAAIAPPTEVQTDLRNSRE